MRAGCWLDFDRVGLSLVGLLGLCLAFDLVRVLDGLTGTAYEDDSQVIDIKATKVYSDAPGVDIEVSDSFDCI